VLAGPIASRAEIPVRGHLGDRPVLREHQRHVAAEYGFFEATRLLLDRGAEVNARATIDANGVGGQTPIFHSLTISKESTPRSVKCSSNAVPT
jgi:hypothetical protein